MANFESRFIHLECSENQDVYSKDQIQTYSQANRPLEARYDLAHPLSPDILKDRPNTMWRYLELLPVEDPQHIVTLGEGMTPIIPFHSRPQVSLKDEALNPTGSFKARGLSMAISKAKELGVSKCVIPTAGNAGGAMSAYCARAGLDAHVYMPKNTPEVFKKECLLLGAKVHTIDGTIKDCAKAIAIQEDQDWFDVSTLKEPYRLEGKKTMGLEIAEQLNWQVPDVIIYPTGGGTGLIGIWKAFQELEQLGWLSGSKKPRMVVVQTDACYPLVNAWEKGHDNPLTFPNPGLTIANGLRVPSAFGGKMIMQILQESNGVALSVSDAEMHQGIQEVAREEGILLSPEGSAVWMAYKKLLAQGQIEDSDQVLLINTGSLYKYMENV